MLADIACATDIFVARGSLLPCLHWCRLALRSLCTDLREHVLQLSVSNFHSTLSRTVYAEASELSQIVLCSLQLL
jgi:hypothetical protein